MWKTTWKEKNPSEHWYLLWWFEHTILAISLERIRLEIYSTRDRDMLNALAIMVLNKAFEWVRLLYTSLSACSQISFASVENANAKLAGCRLWVRASGVSPAILELHSVAEPQTNSSCARTLGEDLRQQRILSHAAFATRINESQRRVRFIHACTQNASGDKSAIFATFG